MKDFEITKKLISLTKMTILQTVNRVRKQEDLSKQFKLERGVKQGDPLSSVLFSLVLEICIRKTKINPGGNMYNRSCQYLAYADGVVIIARTRKGQKAELKINEEKTKYILLTRNER